METVQATGLRVRPLAEPPDLWRRQFHIADDVDNAPDDNAHNRGENSVQQKKLGLLVGQCGKNTLIPAMLGFNALGTEVRAVAALAASLVP
jgi:hypothetical protein